MNSFDYGHRGPYPVHMTGMGDTTRGIGEITREEAELLRDLRASRGEPAPFDATGMPIGTGAPRPARTSVPLRRKVRRTRRQNPAETAAASVAAKNMPTGPSAAGLALDENPHDAIFVAKNISTYRRQIDTYQTRFDALNEDEAIDNELDTKETELRNTRELLERAINAEVAANHDNVRAAYDLAVGTAGFVDPCQAQRDNVAAKEAEVKALELRVEDRDKRLSMLTVQIEEAQAGLSRVSKGKFQDDDLRTAQKAEMEKRFTALRDEIDIAKQNVAAKVRAKTAADNALTAKKGEKPTLWQSVGLLGTTASVVAATGLSMLAGYAGSLCEYVGNVSHDSVCSLTDEGEMEGYLPLAALAIGAIGVFAKYRSSRSKYNKEVAGAQKSLEHHTRNLLAERVELRSVEHKQSIESQKIRYNAVKALTQAYSGDAAIVDNLSERHKERLEKFSASRVKLYSELAGCLRGSQKQVTALAMLRNIETHERAATLNYLASLRTVVEQSPVFSSGVVCDLDNLDEGRIAQALGGVKVVKYMDTSKSEKRVIMTEGGKFVNELSFEDFVILILQNVNKIGTHSNDSTNFWKRSFSIPSAYKSIGTFYHACERNGTVLRVREERSHEKLIKQLVGQLSGADLEQIDKMDDREIMELNVTATSNAYKKLLAKLKISGGNEAKRNAIMYLKGMIAEERKFQGNEAKRKLILNQTATPPTSAEKETAYNTASGSTAYLKFFARYRV